VGGLDVVVVVTGGSTVLDGGGGVVPPPGTVTTYNSPVESLVMKMRLLTLGSHANPTGRKHPDGHALLFGFCITLTSAERLLDGCTGCPSGPKSILLRRYPSAGERFQLPWKVMYAVSPSGENLTSSGAVCEGKVIRGATGWLWQYASVN
jgi:hypothetical protein